MVSLHQEGHSSICLPGKIILVLGGCSGEPSLIPRYPLCNLQPLGFPPPKVSSEVSFMFTSTPNSCPKRLLSLGAALFYLPLYPENLAQEQVHSGLCGSWLSAGKKNNHDYFKHKKKLDAYKISGKDERVGFYFDVSMTLRITPISCPSGISYLEGREGESHCSHPHFTCLRHPQK